MELRAGPYVGIVRPTPRFRAAIGVSLRHNYLNAFEREVPVRMAVAVTRKTHRFPACPRSARTSTIMPSSSKQLNNIASSSVSLEVPTRSSTN